MPGIVPERRGSWTRAPPLSILATMAKHVGRWAGARHDERLNAAVGAVAGVRVTDARDRAAALAAIHEADALVATVVGWGTDFAAAVARAPRLAWMQALNTGIDNVQ